MYIQHLVMNVRNLVMYILNLVMFVRTLDQIVTRTQFQLNEKYMYIIKFQHLLETPEPLQARRIAGGGGGVFSQQTLF